MSTSYIPATGSIRASAVKLFAEKPPVLLEVRFPRMGTSSDWFLCEEITDLDLILDRLGPDAEVHLSSVWDLRDATGGIVMRK